MNIAAYDAFYRAITAVPLKKITSKIAMETVKHTTAYALASVTRR